VNVIICIGGTGTRCFEALNHLAAANMLSNQTYKVIVIDKDSSCGGTEKTQRTINLYNGLQAKLSTNLNSQDVKLCAPCIERDLWDFDAVLDSFGKREKRTLKNTVVNDTFRENDQMLLDLIYSEQEQESDLSRGFYGHPSIGAMLFKYVTQPSQLDNKENQVFMDIKNALTTGISHMNVFIIGSIFGGTGASIFPNIAQLLRDIAGDSVAIRIGGVLLLPYFSVPNPAADADQEKITTITNDEFLTKTTIALEQYDEWGIIRADKSLFNSLYLVGNAPLSCTSSVNANGGSDQVNHFNMVDFYAANAACHFFNYPDLNDLFVAQLSESTVNMCSWINLPEDASTKRKLLQMARFSFYITMSIQPHFTFSRDANQKKKIPALCQTYGTALFGGTKANNEQINDFQKSITATFSYCMQFINFIFDLSYNGVNWSVGGMASRNQAVDCELFDKNILMDVLSRCLRLSKGDPELRLDDFDVVLQAFSRLVIGESHTDMLAIEAMLDADTSLKSSNNPAKYLNKLYEYCAI